MSEPTLFGAGPGGIVGRRQLIAVQTVDLGRLTHHPVPLVPSALVAVSGTGPDRDSNGSGKTTFLASVSLLLGDPEWRVATTAGADAVGLLFDPDLSGDAAGLYDPARVGFIAGVFAQLTADGSYDEITVWVRISAEDSPRLAARWAPGVHLVAERDQAAAMWNSLGRDRQIGPTAFVEQLYGGTGRCLAYVTSRGHRDTDSSLMQLQARLTAARIGSELIILLGLEHLIEGERDLRAQLADAQEKLAARIEEHDQREREWASALHEIEARKGARIAVAEGRRQWQLRLARKLMDALSDVERLQADMSELEADKMEASAALADLEARAADAIDPSTLDEVVAAAQQKAEEAHESYNQAAQAVARHDMELQMLAERIGRLMQQALAVPSGLSLEEAESRAREAAGEIDRTTRMLGASEAELEDARTALQVISDHGDADPSARAALEAAQVSAAPLLDGIVLADGARAMWEPVLAPWRGAFTVPAAHRDRAVAAAPAGTVLVVLDEGASAEMPGDVLEAPPGVERFLRALIDRSDPSYVDVAAGVVVAGGFEYELCGRDAAIARARTRVEKAEHRNQQAVARRDAAQRGHELATDSVSRLRAVAELTQLRPEETVKSQTLAGARQEQAAREEAHRQSQQLLVDAKVRHGTAVQERARLETELQAARDRVDRIERDERAAQEAIARIDVASWRRAWGDTDDAAAVTLDGDDRKEESIRKRATELLVTALERLGIDSTTGHGAPTPAIAGVIQARSGLDEEVVAANEVRRFDTVVQPLADWLDELAEQDGTFLEEVEIERDRWEEVIDAARRECETQSDLLDRQRDMVEQQIEGALGHVSARYGELDSAAGGYGAQLRWQSIRPQHPTDLWVWEVRPEWRRGHGAKWLPYTRQANSAMQKQHRTHLVLAALLAAQDPAGRVLIVDEAGNDFGREHLRQVLTAFAHVAESHGVTVIAACQDKVLEEVAALGAARLLLWFERLTDAAALCRPTRVWGFDPERGRVEVTRPPVEAGRLL